MKNIFQRTLMTGILSWGIMAGAQAAGVTNITFKDTDIRVVLAAIAQFAQSEGKDINIVPGPTVTGNVNIDLTQVDWETALDVILRTYNLDAYRQENVIMVTPIGPGGSVVKNEIQIKVFHLKYIDANDALKAIEPVLSSNGKTSVLQTTGQSGWEFGTATTNTNSNTTDNKLKRTSILVVSDSAERLDHIATLLEQLDVMPKQILIKARILEVQYNLLKDSGLEWETGTGPGGFVNSGNTSQIAGSSTSNVTPSTFTPLTTGLSPSNSGVNFAFQQLTGTQYEIILHSLEEETGTNTLSAPVLTTLNNQEATILVGEQFPIIETTVSTTTNDVVGGSLQEYQDIGIKLNVDPQVWGPQGNYINLIVHPVVSTSNSSEKVIDGSTNTTLVEYPIINTQEAETQLVIPDNGTVMMGGLITDVKSNQKIGIPILSDIPLLGQLFTRTVKNTQKMELIIFLTAHIMAPEEQVPFDIVNTKHVEDQFTEQKIGK